MAVKNETVHQMAEKESINVAYYNSTLVLPKVTVHEENSC